MDSGAVAAVTIRDNVLVECVVFAGVDIGIGPVRLGMSVSRRCGWLSLKRCGRFLKGTGLILPARDRARAEIRVRTFLAEGYAASIGRQRSVTEGPDPDEFGRNHDSAQVEVPSSSFGGSTAASRRRRSRHATRLSSLTRQGGWWFRLDTMAVHADR